ncbi:MAG: Veg family protein [Clostridia bacterium]|nr:Veg family protein [Clostridia bacterium]
MIKQKNDIAAVKKLIADYFNQQVDVVVNLGRNKILKFTGELSGVYPALFTVRPNEKGFLGKTSYSYAEVLCGSVRVKPAIKKAE